jgi:hypothetical protein
MLEFLAHQGFELWNLMPGTSDPETDRLLQVDGVFFRPGSAAISPGVVVGAQWPSARVD